MADSKELEAKISLMPKADLAELADQDTYSKSEYRGMVVEECCLDSHSAIRLKVLDIDLVKPSTVAQSRTARSVEQLTDKVTHPASTPEMQRWIMSALEARDVYVPGLQDLKQRRHNLLRIAIEILWLHKDKWDSIVVEMKAGPRGKAHREALEKVGEYYYPPVKDDLRQFDRDRAAAGESDILWRIEGKTIVLVVDSKDRIMAFFFNEAMQQLYHGDIAEDVVKCLDTWTHHAPIKLPERKRHAAVRAWLRDNPHIDVSVTKDPESKCGVDHYGAYAAVGDPGGKKVHRGLGRRKHFQHEDLLEEPADELFHGPLAAVTDAINFFFEALDPELHAAYREVCDTIPHGRQLRTKDEGETFLLRALLTNVLTTDHIDRGDWWGGLAGIVPFGSYQGKRPLQLLVCL